MIEFMCGFDYAASGGVNQMLFANGMISLSDGLSGATSATARTGRSYGPFASAANFIGKRSLTNDATWVMGLAIRFTTLTTPRIFFSFGDGDPTANATTQVGIGFDTGGHLEVRRGNAATASAAGTVLGTTTATYAINTFYYVEFVVTVHSSAGTIDVYVDGANVLSLTGQNTQNTANTQINSWCLGGWGSSSVHIDDMVLIRSGGAAPNARVGAIKILTSVVGTDAAVGAGDLTASTPSTGTDRGAMVDEATTVDDDTTYNALASAGDADSYKKAALGVTGTVIAVAAQALMRKSETGLAKGQVGVRLSGTNYLGDDTTMSLDYKVVRKTWALNPATAAPWTISEVNAAQPIAKRTT